VGEDRGGQEWREGVKHIRGKDISEMADGTRPGLKVHEGAVAGLPVSLDIAVDVEGIYVVEEGAILQWQG